MFLLMVVSAHRIKEFAMRCPNSWAHGYVSLARSYQWCISIK